MTDIDKLMAALSLAAWRCRGRRAELRKNRVGDLCLIVDDVYVAFIDLTTFTLEEVPS